MMTVDVNNKQTMKETKKKEETEEIDTLRYNVIKN